LVSGPGSQSFLGLLPSLRLPSRVAVVGFTYSEHAPSWRRAGHRVSEVDGSVEAAAEEGNDVVVVVNPNNPDGRVHPRASLARVARRLAADGGLLVVDEAFADLAPSASVVDLAAREGVVVLRSFGKFFGLSGLRLGFAISAPALASRLAAMLGPWPVSGPAAVIGARALADPDFALATRTRLAAAARRLRATVRAAGLASAGGTDLYVLVDDPRASRLHEHLARRGLLTRAFRERPRWHRHGLPPDEGAWARHEQALAEWRREPGA
jgi:cobalamin biosynthetic protein CobC